jgi:hypothetical protein
LLESAFSLSPGVSRLWLDKQGDAACPVDRIAQESPEGGHLEVTAMAEGGVKDAPASGGGVDPSDGFRLGDAFGATGHQNLYARRQRGVLIE